MTRLAPPSARRSRPDIDAFLIRDEEDPVSRHFVVRLEAFEVEAADSEEARSIAEQAIKITHPTISLQENWFAVAMPIDDAQVYDARWLLHRDATYFEHWILPSGHRKCSREGCDLAGHEKIMARSRGRWYCPAHAPPRRPPRAR